MSDKHTVQIGVEFLLKLRNRISVDSNTSQMLQMKQNESFTPRLGCNEIQHVVPFKIILLVSK